MVSYCNDEFDEEPAQVTSPQVEALDIDLEGSGELELLDVTSQVAEERAELAEYGEETLLDEPSDASFATIHLSRGGGGCGGGGGGGAGERAGGGGRGGGGGGSRLGDLSNIEGGSDSDSEDSDGGWGGGSAEEEARLTPAARGAGGGGGRKGRRGRGRRGGGGGRESWEQTERRLRASSVYGRIRGWHALSFIVKSFDDLREEVHTHTRTHTHTHTHTYILYI